MTPIEVFWSSLDLPIRIGSQVFAFSWASIILEFIVPLLGLLLVLTLLTKWARSIISRTNLVGERKTRILKGIRIWFRLLYIAVLLLLLARFLEDRIVQFIEEIMGAVATPFYVSGNTRISVVTILLAIPLLLVSNLAGKASRIAFEKSKIFVHNLDESRRNSIATLLRYTVMAVVLIVGLSVIGIDLSAINTILLVFGVGVIAGLYQVLANFFAGLMMILNRPIKEGDLIELEAASGNQEGMVKSIRMINSIIESPHGETIIIPNTQLLYRSVKNFSTHDAHSSVAVHLAIDYDEDAEAALKTLESVAKRCPFWNGAEDPVSSISAFGEYGIELSLSLRLGAAPDRDRALAWLHEEIYKEFRGNRIKFASAKK